MANSVQAFLLAFCCSQALAKSAGASTSIVVFKEGLVASQHAAHMDSAARSGTIQHEFSIGSLKGYAIAASPENVAALRMSPEVAYVEKDIPMRLKSHGQQSGSCRVEQNAPSWGLQRISEKSLPLQGAYNYPADVGDDVDVYVLDTGVRITHHDFEGRASFGFNAAGGKIDTDKDGHGTAVAGIVASKTYGVCKQCKIISVKIFTDGGDTSASPIIAAFNWVAKHFNKGRKIVINISVGGDPGETSDAMDAAVNALVEMGVHVVAAAGNENVDACTESPGRAKGILGVGSSDILLGSNDIFLGGSNFGDCVKVLAPGNTISSLGCDSDTATSAGDLSGTSFSSPHVAGVLAELASLNKNSSLAEVQQMLYSNALSGVVELVPKGTKNLLLHRDCPTSLMV